MYHILCVDDNDSFLFGLKTSLKAKYQVSITHSFEDALKTLATEQIDLVLLDVNLGKKRNGINLIRTLKDLDPSLVVVMLTGYRDPKLVVSAMKRGASDYLTKPYPYEELIAVIEKNLAHKSALDKKEALVEYYSHGSHEMKDMIGDSDAVHEIIKKIKKLKGHRATVLIDGESGTGKEVLARCIHKVEQNPSRPFIAVNCAAIPDNLIESELFGHEQGSFTGAGNRKIGKFELANGGDIFLDEINSLKSSLQSKLLRVLEDKEFYRVGGNQRIKADFRVIAATNKELQGEVDAGVFREDLMYRLQVISFSIPPLRKRLSDIKLLVAHFLKKHSSGEKPKVLSMEAAQIIKNYSWPGNIRQLENLIQSLVIMTRSDRIEAQDLPDWLASAPKVPIKEYLEPKRLTHEKIEEDLKDYVKEKEVEYIKRAIKDNSGNITKAAKMLKISRSKVYWTLRNYT